MHRSSIIFPCLSSIQAQGKLSPWDPFSGLWKRPVCVPRPCSDYVPATDPLLQDGSPHASANLSPIHLLVPEWALRGQAPEEPWEGVGALAPCCAWACTQHPSFLVHRVWPLTLRSAPFCFPISLPSSFLPCHNLGRKGVFAPVFCFPPQPPEVWLAEIWPNPQNL